jgi:hypothetical protein
MSKLNHTPGPWKCWGNGDLLLSVSPNRASVSDICHIHLIDEVKETNANAFLIAASPDMLDVLIKNYTTYQVLREVFENNHPDIWDMIRGAYLKTPGKTREAIESATGLPIEEVLK